jgi:hypothetical protein
MNAALWALVGVAATAAFGIARDWVNENRRTTVRGKEEREAEERAARIACMVIAEELDTHAMNYRKLAEDGGTPSWPIAQTPNFFPTGEWEAHNLELARLSSLPVETWVRLARAYHNAREIRSRVELLPPKSKFRAEGISDLRENADRADGLRDILKQRAEDIHAQFSPGPGRLTRLRRWSVST